jgi:hypothetical protein
LARTGGAGRCGNLIQVIQKPESVVSDRFVSAAPHTDASDDSERLAYWPSGQQRLADRVEVIAFRGFSVGATSPDRIVSPRMAKSSLEVAAVPSIHDSMESRPTRDTQGRSDQRSDRLVRRRVRLGSVCSPASAAGEQVGVALSGAEQVGTMRWFPVNADGAGRYVVHLVIEVNHYA